MELQRSSLVVDFRNGTRARVIDHVYEWFLLPSGVVEGNHILVARCRALDGAALNGVVLRMPSTGQVHSFPYRVAEIPQ